jgi:hypothetical protein
VPEEQQTFALNKHAIASSVELPMFYGNLKANISRDLSSNVFCIPNEYIQS